MKRTFGSIRTGALAFVLISLAFMCPAGHAQEQHWKQSERARLIKAAREIMGAARYCALVTLDTLGRPYARTMDPFPPDENMVVWFGTNPNSRKVRQIRRNQRVTLYYFDRENQEYVTILGKARVVTDAKEKSKWWKEEWQAFYPDRSKGYLLIAVTPDKLEVVSEKKGILGDPRAWTPPSVTFKPQP